ncbi:MAG: hypothetical protein Q7J98_13170 [Kiritimatiellia bacterium]|nr:hypothetical protein [Kiritimatiellia bacterium]
MKRKMNLAAAFLVSVLITTEGVCGLSQNIIDGVDWSGGVQASHAKKYTCLTGELADSFWEYPADGTEFMKWQSAVVPENLRSNKVTFIMASGLGCNSGENGLHELFMNGRKILEINTPYEATIGWEAELASAKFETVFIDKNDDLFGIFSVTINPEVIDYGKRQNFEMKGKKCLCKSWFSISKVGNLRGLNVKELQSKAKVSARLAGIKAAGNMLSAAEGMLSDGICAWYWNKAGAVTITNEKAIIPKGDKTLVFNAEGKNLPDDANAMVDKAANEKKWLIEVYPESVQKSAEEGSRKHREYLKKLDYAIWNDSLEKIGNYLKMRKCAKVIKDDDGKGRIKAALIGFPEGFKSEQPLTAIITLPSQTRKAKAFCGGQEVRCEHISFRETCWIKFDVFPGGKQVDIYYEK